MGLRERITAALRAAEAEEDAARAGTLRLLAAALRDRESAARSDGEDGALDEAEVQALLIRLAGQCRDTARVLEEAGRLEQSEGKAAEAAVIEAFLPRRLSDDEIAAMIDAAVAAENATSLRDIGRVMAALKPRLGNQVEPADLKARVKARLEHGG